MVDERFPKSMRVRTQNEFDLVYRSDTFAADNVLVIRGRSNGRPETRLGLSISKRVGNAVVRNRWKRIIRESFRKQASQLPKGLDIVVRPRKGAKCEYRAVYRSIEKLLTRLARDSQRGKGGGE